MTAKRLTVLIIAILFMIFALWCVATANQMYEALLEADLSQHQDQTLPGEAVIAFMAVAMTSSATGFVGVLFFAASAILLIALICKFQNRLRLLPIGLLVLGTALMFLV
jgi:hypothetical protein